MSITFRPYQTTDQATFKVLLKELFLSEAKFNFLRLSEPTPDYLETYFHELMEHLSKNQGTIIMACDQKQVVGYVVGYWQPQTPTDLKEYQAHKTGHVSDMLVSPTYQGMGIGRQLMLEIERYFKTQGYDLIKLEVSASNQAAHQLYQKLDYHDNLIEMFKKIC